MMTIKEEVQRFRELSNQAQQLIAFKKKVAEDFDRGILTHDRLDRYTEEREKILSGIISNNTENNKT